MNKTDFIDCFTTNLKNLSIMKRMVDSKYLIKFNWWKIVTCFRKSFKLKIIEKKEKILQIYIEKVYIEIVKIKIDISTD